MKNYEVIILAAGRGTRLGVLGEHLPKALIRTGKKSETMVSRLIEQFCFADKIHVVVGHHRDLVSPYLHENYPWVNVIPNEHYAELPNSVSLLKGLQCIKKDCSQIIIIDVDTYLSDQASAELKELAISTSDGIIFTTQSKRPDGEWAICFDEDNNITSIAVDAKNGDNITSGVTLFNNQSLKHLLDKMMNSDLSNLKYWDDIYFYNFRDMNMKGYPISGFVAEVDTLEDIDTLWKRGAKL